MPYNITAIAKSKCKILKIPKAEFLQILNENPDVSLRLFGHIANRLSDRYYMLFTLISQDPAARIESVLNYLKRDFMEMKPFSFEVPLTRQQLANLTGLRVETVIRTVKKMENENRIKIKNRRIYC
ncbi:Crp/Fnr family transcriptional regulator [Chryseobacterium arachidis]|uniref:Crp/Fnr family transcriptional regulator n=1 Tax=Chryseobacterium arachidis TaxID=1416778 RepID=UPI00360F2F07